MAFLSRVCSVGHKYLLLQYFGKLRITINITITIITNHITIITIVIVLLLPFTTVTRLSNYDLRWRGWNRRVPRRLGRTARCSGTLAIGRLWRLVVLVGCCGCLLWLLVVIGCCGRLLWLVVVVGGCSWSLWLGLFE